MYVREEYLCVCTRMYMCAARLLTFILDRTYVGPPCDLLLTSTFSPGGLELWAWPSMVLEGSSGWVWPSLRVCLLLRQSGVISARLASASIIIGGKMDTMGGAEGEDI